MRPGVVFGAWLLLAAALVFLVSIGFEQVNRLHQRERERSVEEPAERCPLCIEEPPGAVAPDTTRWRAITRPSL